jgi:hypothetical protein
MHTTDGCTITTIEQEGDFVGHDVGRIWIRSRNTWTWYGGFANTARKQEVLTQAQKMTALEFDTWFETTP